MPDDEQVTEQTIENPEAEPGEDELAAFDEEAGEVEVEDTEEATDDEPEAEDDGEPDKDEPEKPEADEPPEKPEGEDDDDDPAKRLEKRLAEIEEPEKPEPPKPPDPAKQPAKPEDGPAPVSIDQLSLFNNAITIDQLPDANIVVGKDADGKEHKVNVREFLNEDPEMFAAVKAVSGAMNAAMLRSLIAGGYLSTSQSVKGEVGQVGQNIGTLQEKLEDMEFDLAVSDLGHPEFRKCRLGIDKDFMAWREKAPPRLVKLMTSLQTPEDAALVMENYKASIAESRTKEVDGKARETKAKKDALHKQTTSRKGAAPKTGGKDEVLSEEDERAAFNEEASNPEI